MKSIKILSLLLSFAALFVACENNEDHEPAVQLRTVLVYIAGDNSLRQFAEYDLEEILVGMKDVDDSSNNLLVYYDDGSHTKLVRIRKDKKKNVIQETISTYESRNSVSVSNMKEVMNVAFSKYPAQNYGLVLWSHGEGWISKGNHTRWWGDDRSSYMDISDLHEVLLGVPHLEFLLFDACFMQSVEVLYELKDQANYIIGSPTEIPAPGAPYQVVVPAMFASNSPAISIAEAYYGFYEKLYTGSLGDWNYEKPWNAGVSVSVVKTAMLEQLADITHKILPQYIVDGQRVPVSDVLCYDRRSSKYYYDFDGLMRTLNCSTNEYQTWKSIYDATVICWRTTATNYSDYGGNFSMEGSAGLSTYIPRTLGNTLTFYRTLSWYSASGWNETGW